MPRWKPDSGGFALKADCGPAVLWFMNFLARLGLAAEPALAEFRHTLGVWWLQAWVRKIWLCILGFPSEVRRFVQLWLKAKLRDWKTGEATGPSNLQWLSGKQCGKGATLRSGQCRLERDAADWATLKILSPVEKQVPGALPPAKTDFLCQISLQLC